MSLKTVELLVLVSVAAIWLSGCSGQKPEWLPDSDISVISREAGSGTRSSFVEIFDIKEQTEYGEEDMITEEAVITNNTAVALSAVAGDDFAVSYISLGSLNDSVKALKIGGIYPEAEYISDGTYQAARSFKMVSRGQLSENARDFMEFILSETGQTLVTANQYVPVEVKNEYQPKEIKGKVTVAGSSSVSPLMEKLKEAYQEQNPQVQVEIQQSDSTTGITSVSVGLVDLAMSSRELQEDEISQGLADTNIALDGIVIIVNHRNPNEDLTAEQLKNIFNGSLVKWKEVTD